jgi:hypothetical protein
MNYGRHRLDDECSRDSGKVWKWLLVNRAALRLPDRELPVSAAKAPVLGFDEGAQRQTGWREALGGWRRQTLTRQICDFFFHPHSGDETRTAHLREGSAVPPVLWNELLWNGLRPRRADEPASRPQDLRLEDLLPESALRRVALPQVERTSGQSSILAKAA